MPIIRQVILWPAASERALMICSASHRPAGQARLGPNSASQIIDNDGYDDDNVTSRPNGSRLLVRGLPVIAGRDLDYEKPPGGRADQWLSGVVCAPNSG